MGRLLLTYASFLAIFMAIQSPARGQAWTFETPFTATYFDLAVEANGTPHIVFTNCTHRELCFGSPMPRFLIHAVRSDGVWMNDTLAADPSGFTPALALDDTGGVHVVYADSLLDLRYIYGSSGGPWAKESLPHSDPDYFRNEPAIALDDSGGVHVSYNEREQIWYQYRSSAGWNEERVTYNIGDNDIARSSIKVGNDGIVRIAHWSLYTNGVMYEKIGGLWTENITGAYRGEFPSLVLGSGDDAHILCSNFDGVAYVTNQSGSWVQTILHPDGGAGDIALTAAEVPIVAYPAAVLGYDTTFYYDIDLHVSVQVDSFWQRESLVSYISRGFGGPGADFRPRIAIDSVNNLHIAYSDPRNRDLVYGYRDVPTAVAEPTVPAPSQVTRLRAAFPNPFNPNVTITYDVDRRRPVRIAVYDVRGRHVRTLLDEVRPPGVHRVVWNGMDSAGTRMASGVYFVRMVSADRLDSKTIVLLK